MTRPSGLRRVLTTAVAAAAFVAVPALAPTAAGAGGVPAPVYGQGDIFVSASDGVREYTPTGTLVRTLTTGTGTAPAGSAFDGSGNLLVANPYAGTISKFDSQGTYAGVVVDESQIHGAPSSISIADNGSFYDGDYYPYYYGYFRKYLPPGTLIKQYQVENVFNPERIALSSDQCTLYYTAGGPLVSAFDVCTDVPLPPVTTTLPSPAAAGLKEVPGSGGQLLVDDEDRVVLLNPDGSIAQTYQPSVPRSYLYDLDPDGTSFWTVDAQNGNVYHYRIADGALLARFSSGHSRNEPTVNRLGLSVFDGRNVSLNAVPVDDAGPPVTGLTGDPITVHGSASDAEGDPLVTDWTASTPACSFADPHALDTTLTCSSNGTFTLYLSADDGHNPAQFDSTQITIGGGPCLGLTPTDGVTHAVNPKTGVTIFTGTPGNDVITGTNGPDAINGGSGEDTICGGAGADIVHGGKGNDRISGGAGNDQVHGDGGNDNVVGDSANDSVFGEAGNDRLAGSGGTDSCDGGGGTDIASNGCETVTNTP